MFLKFNQTALYVLVRGLKTARLSGTAMLNNGLAADICLSSTALRCVQTCERILTGT